MRIGIDGRMINESGIGRYLKNLLIHLQKLDSKNEYFIFLLKKDFLNLKFNRNFSKVLADFKWYGVKEQLNFPRILGQYKLDLVHFPHFNVPVLYGCHYVVTIHDLIHQHFQMRKASTLDPITYRIKAKAYRLIFKRALNGSEKILVPTQSVKDQLISDWNVNPNKILVTPEGVEERIIKLAQKKSSTIIKGEYLFYIGNAHPHKNLEKLIKAFRILRQDHPGLKLVLSGKENYFWKRLKSEYPSEGIIYTGYISDEQMVTLYQNAKAFITPSLEEGFGIPVLEAFACGCPVIGSDIKVIKEVGGRGVQYFNPEDENDIAGQINFILSNQVARNKLIIEGYVRYKQFSWAKMARQTLEVYQSCG